MPIIRAHSGVITQINVFTVPPGNQQQLIDLLVESAEFARSIPGWMSASIHRSLDGTRVVNYAQSDSLDASKRIVDRLREEGYLQRNQALAVANPGLYEVVRTLEI